MAVRLESGERSQSPTSTSRRTTTARWSEPVVTRVTASPGPGPWTSSATGVSQDPEACGRPLLEPDQVGGEVQDGPQCPDGPGPDRAHPGCSRTPRWSHAVRRA